jgi:hypothetical protein
MVEQVDIASHTLELLRRMNGKLDSIGLEMADLKLRLSANEDHLQGLVTSVAGLTHRMDRVEGRLDRIERRLDLRDGTDI